MISGQIKTLYKNHIKNRIKESHFILNKNNISGMIIASGEPYYYPFDDQHAHFRTNPHFSHWCPSLSPKQFIVITNDSTPQICRIKTKDYWIDLSNEVDNFWEDSFSVLDFDNEKNLHNHLKMNTTNKFIFIGEKNKSNRKLCDYLETPINPVDFITELNWDRSKKTAYEHLCIEKANESASTAHKKAKESFLNGSSELEIYYAYLNALQTTESSLPYGAIIGLNEKSAILHYQHKRTIKNGNNLLIDAGTTYLGYCSDITRTYLKKNAHPVFINLAQQLDNIQKNICKKTITHASFKELHHMCSIKIGEILKEADLIKPCSNDFLIEKGILKTFFPHGLGHMLGIQVHDVGGLQEDRHGSSQSTNTNTTLRTCRKLREDEVITIEPGIYFIPMLLDRLKSDSTISSYIHWQLVNELIPFGGIRIEDNIIVKNEEPVNITNKYLDHTILV